eukprot:IDg10708t1
MHLSFSSGSFQTIKGSTCKTGQRKADRLSSSASDRHQIESRQAPAVKTNLNPLR